MARFARRGFSRSGGRSKPVHPVTWCARDHLNTAINSSATNQVDICGEDEFEKYTNPTIVRVRAELRLGLVPDGAAPFAAQEHCWAFVGLIIVEGDHTWTAGLNTKDGLENPWLWLGYAQLRLDANFTFTSTGALNTAAFSSQDQSQRYLSIDAKAMRRVPRGHKLIMVGTNVALTGSPNFAINGMIRVLIKE